MRTLLAESFPPESTADGSSASGTGFLRPGWVQQSLLRAIRKGGIPEIAALANDSSKTTKAQRTFFGDAVLASSANLTEVGVDGMVIATPGASRVEDALAALGRGISTSVESAGAPGIESRQVALPQIRPTLESQRESQLPHESP